MLKKCLLALVLTAFLAVTAQAIIQDQTYDCGRWGYKGHPYPWPVEYKKVEICRIPLWMEIGFYIEVCGCDDAEILLEQVDCEEIGRKKTEWPCYYGCAKIQIRSNFEVEIDGDVDHSVDMSHQERFTGCGMTLKEPVKCPGDSAWHEIEACVRAYNVKLLGETPTGQAVNIGYLSIRARPTGSPP